MSEAHEVAADIPTGKVTTARRRKLRQAAFVYLHYGILYQSVVYVLAQRGMVSPERGPLWLWFLTGVLIVALVFWALWFRESVWTARIIWAVHSLRVPTLLGGAFFPDAAQSLPSAFYITALLVVLVNLWMLARAGWDL